MKLSSTEKWKPNDQTDTLENYRAFFNVRIPPSSSYTYQDMICPVLTTKKLDGTNVMYFLRNSVFFLFFSVVNAVQKTRIFFVWIDIFVVHPLGSFFISSVNFFVFCFFFVLVNRKILPKNHQFVYPFHIRIYSNVFMFLIFNRGYNLQNQQVTFWEWGRLYTF